MVYFINLVAHNLLAANWTVQASSPTAMVVGTTTIDPPTVVLAGQTDVSIGRFEAGFLTGTEGAALFHVDGMGPNDLGYGDPQYTMGLAAKMPLIGDNSCAVAFSSLYWFQYKPNPQQYDIPQVDSLFKGPESSNMVVSGKDGKPLYKLYCTIEQGTQVTAHFFATPLDQ